MNPKDFIEKLQSLSFDNTFNPYVDCCKTYDSIDAPIIRREALLSILQVAANSEIDSIWIGRDLGYRGGRRTGLALTDDAHISSHAARWGLSFDKPTIGEVVVERTAATIWEVLEQINSNIFLWNVFPFHPHESFNPFTNRSHNSHEKRVGEDLLSDLVEMLSPFKIIAIGNDAAISANKLFDSSKIYKVRHPSYGGQNQFISEISDIYGLVKRKNQMDLF